MAAVLDWTVRHVLEQLFEVPPGQLGFGQDGSLTPRLKSLYAALGMALTTNVYVDGFNLYYGSLRTTPYKWLDLEALFALLLPESNIKRIRYFTARIKARPDDLDGPNRQEAYIAALGSLTKVSVHYGHFQASKVPMRLVDPPPNGPASVKVHKMEEKGSDVNLATWMLIDAFDRDCEQAVMVTNDSDLALPMEVVSQRLGLAVGLINPHPGGASRELLKRNPAFTKSVRRSALAACQLPDHIAVGKRRLHRPASW